MSRRSRKSNEAGACTSRKSARVRSALVPAALRSLETAVPIAPPQLTGQALRNSAKGEQKHRHEYVHTRRIGAIGLWCNPLCAPSHLFVVADTDAKHATRAR